MNKTLNQNEDHLKELKLAAIKYVKAGLPIVPMGFNGGDQSEEYNYKRPLVRWRDDDAPAVTIEKVEYYFRTFGSKIFGIATLVDPSKYTFVDFDTEESSTLFELPKVPTIKTGKGYHMWFGAETDLKVNGPLDLSEFEIRDGKKYQIEIYTQKRLEVLPPSLHHLGKRYEWVSHYREYKSLPPLPDEVKKLCRCKQKIKKPKSVLFETAHEGARHDALKKACCALFNKHKGNEDKLRTLTHKWNQNKCVPPLDQNEVDDMVDWVLENLETKSAGKEEKEDPVAELIAMFESEYNIVTFHDQDKRGYVQVNQGNKSSNVLIRSNAFEEYLSLAAYKNFTAAVSDSEVKAVQNILTAKALYDSPQHNLYHRVASDGETFYYDLCNEAGEMVEVSSNGWRIVSRSENPFLFKQGTATEQVTPEQGGDLKELLNLTNLQNSDDQMLFLCTLPVRMIRDIEQAIIYFYGPAGSAKTSLLKLTKDLIDPSRGGISMPVKNAEELSVLLNQTWLFANDNISRINNELSDFLCIAATGAESARRTLYTNSDITVHTVKNPMYLTGINIAARNSDLLSRTLSFKTEAIPKDKLRSSSEIKAEYVELKPKLLGAIFGVLASAIEIKPSLVHRTGFRMHDFAIWGAACAEVLGYGADEFERALRESINMRAYDAIQSVSSGRAVLKLLEQCGRFEGSTTELLRILKGEYVDDVHEVSNRGWHEPVAHNPESLSKALRSLENSFNEVGIITDFDRRTSTERLISFEWPEKLEKLGELGNKDF